MTTGSPPLGGEVINWSRVRVGTALLLNSRFAFATWGQLVSESSFTVPSTQTNYPRRTRPSVCFTAVPALFLVVQLSVSCRG
jgi:hypothetical protein